MPLVLFFIIVASITLALPALAAEREGVRYGGYPVMQFNSDEGLILGFFGQRFDYGSPAHSPFQSHTILNATVAAHGNRYVSLGYAETHLTPWDLRLETEAYWLENPFQNYFGIGDSTIIDPVLDAVDYYRFLRRSSGFGFSFRKVIDGPWSVAAGFGLELDLLTPNHLESSYERDFGGKARILEVPIRLGLRWDKRDSEFIPSSGALANVTLELPGSTFIGSKAWARSDLDFRHYWSLVSDRWLTLASQWRYAVATSETPLLHKPRLGSLGTLRGLRINRYLTNHSTSLRNELRTVPIRFEALGLPAKIGTGIFADLGRVGDDLSRLISGETHAAYGFTFFGSYFTDDFVGHLDVGFSSEGSIVYLSVGQTI